MQRFMWMVLISGLFGSVFERGAEAQMFGARSFGTSLQPQSSPGGGSFGGPTPAPGVGSGAGAVPPSATGVASGDSRFVRKNRTSADFVGKDSKDSQRVVGAAQVAQGIGSQPAALEAVERRVPETLLNPPRTPAPRTRMYEPKLVVGFRHNPRSASEVSASLRGQAKYLNQLNPSLRVTMTVEGETAHLEGEVGSEEERALIEQMVLFEPGISSVQNDLKVPVVGPSEPFVR